MKLTRYSIKSGVFGKALIFILPFFLLQCTSSTSEVPWPDPDWQAATPEELALNVHKLRQARDYALTGGGAGYIIKNGKLVMSWGDPRQRHDLKSTTKSIGVTTLGLALQDGLVMLGDRARHYHTPLGTPPDYNDTTGWLDDITLLHLATQTAGFDKPGGYTRLLFQPGTKWAYSDGGPNWLAECLTLLYQRDLNEVLFERVFTPLGITTEDLFWRNNAYRNDTLTGLKRREFGSGIHANVDAMARIGYLYLRGGRWKDRQIIPKWFVDQTRTTIPAIAGLSVVNDPQKHHAGASKHYGLLWWNNADGSLPGIPEDAFWSAGLHDSFIIVIPSLDLVVARAGKGWEGQRSPSYYTILAPFIVPIAAACVPNPDQKIIGMTWADTSTIMRMAHGSDNWPVTWAEDDVLYTAYGDGWGFEPKVDHKLSLGFAGIIGTPPHVTGINIRSTTGEQLGDGKSGLKASSLLALDGMLYLWARNANHNGEQAQLAWSSDKGQTWSWCPWVFREFGYPVFLNFGKNNANAIDNYVYLYSPDTPSAYDEGDRVILMRVPGDGITNRDEYEFFAKLDHDRQPV